MTTKRYGQEITSEDGSDAISFSIVVDVLNGLSYVQAGKKYNMSGPAAFKRFWLRCVNRPFKTILPVSTKDINKLRQSWDEFHSLKI